MLFGKMTVLAGMQSFSGSLLAMKSIDGGDDPLSVAAGVGIAATLLVMLLLPLFLLRSRK